VAAEHSLYVFCDFFDSPQTKNHRESGTKVMQRLPVTIRIIYFFCSWAIWEDNMLSYVLVTANKRPANGNKKTRSGGTQQTRPQQLTFTLESDCDPLKMKND
jgi:hypothetical protein